MTVSFPDLPTVQFLITYTTLHHFLSISLDEQQSIMGHILLLCRNPVNNSLHKTCMLYIVYMLYQNSLHKTEFTYCSVQKNNSLHKTCMMYRIVYTKLSYSILSQCCINWIYYLGRGKDWEIHHMSDGNGCLGRQRLGMEGSKRRTILSSQCHSKCWSSKCLRSRTSLSVVKYKERVCGCPGQKGFYHIFQLHHLTSEALYL